MPLSTKLARVDTCGHLIIFSNGSVIFIKFCCLTSIFSCWSHEYKSMSSLYPGISSCLQAACLEDLIKAGNLTAAPSYFPWRSTGADAPTCIMVCSPTSISCHLPVPSFSMAMAVLGIKNRLLPVLGNGTEVEAGGLGAGIGGLKVIWVTEAGVIKESPQDLGLVRLLSRPCWLLGLVVMFCTRRASEQETDCWVRSSACTLKKEIICCHFSPLREQD